MIGGLDQAIETFLEFEKTLEKARKCDELKQLFRDLLNAQSVEEYWRIFNKLKEESLC